MIIFWCFPGMLINLILKFTFLTILIVAFVGIISNIHTVCATAPFLAWICTLPSEVVGIISVMSMFLLLLFLLLFILGFVFFLKKKGILPPALLAVLMMLLPIILRLLARFEGIPQYTGLELSLMTRFFIFQVFVSNPHSCKIQI